jgi:hypothetical protein
MLKLCFWSFSFVRFVHFKCVINYRSLHTFENRYAALLNHENLPLYPALSGLRAPFVFDGSRGLTNVESADEPRQQRHDLDVIAQVNCEPHEYRHHQRDRFVAMWKSASRRRSHLRRDLTPNVGRARWN